MDRKEKLELQKFATQIRIETVKQVVVRGFGHLGGSLSIVDALAVLYAKEMRVDPKTQLGRTVTSWSAPKDTRARRFIPLWR